MHMRTGTFRTLRCSSFTLALPLLRHQAHAAVGPRLLQAQELVQSSGLRTLIAMVKTSATILLPPLRNVAKAALKLLVVPHSLTTYLMGTFPPLATSRKAASRQKGLASVDAHRAPWMESQHPHLHRPLQESVAAITLRTQTAMALTSPISPLRRRMNAVIDALGTLVALPSLTMLQMVTGRRTAI
jgi:hypothetical protein